jgi:hypothetical protein
MNASVTATRGAEFLDKKVPGWANMVDLNTFNLEQTCHCVIGQIASGLHPRARHSSYLRFCKGLKELGISNADAHRFGFFGMNGGLVDRTWRRLIKQRQAA